MKNHLILKIKEWIRLDTLCYRTRWGARNFEKEFLEIRHLSRWKEVNVFSRISRYLLGLIKYRLSFCLKTLKNLIQNLLICLICFRNESLFNTLSYFNKFKQNFKAMFIKLEMGSRMWVHNARLGLPNIKFWKLNENKAKLINLLFFYVFVSRLMYFCVIKRRIDGHVRHGKEAIAIQQRTNSLSCVISNRTPDVIIGPSTRLLSNDMFCFFLNKLENEKFSLIF